MHDTFAIFQFLETHRASGEAVALVTITDASGPSSRDPGAHMAVSETGAYAGSFSGGCIEAAVVSEACAAIKQGRPRLVRFGTGSPFIDIRLPCGGSVELLISPLRREDFASTVLDLIGHRQPVGLQLARAGQLVAQACGAERNGACWQGEIFHVQHVPPLKIILLGNGAQVEIMFTLAKSFGASTEVLTSDREIAARITGQGGNARYLHTLAQAGHFTPDRWTACVCLFHDHDWEPVPLNHAVAGGAFYIGAMGSRRTAETRRALLRETGMSAAAIDKIRGPIGLMQRSRDPYTLALSVLAEIVDEYNRIAMPQGE